jgi:hypothetical protein
LETQNCTQLGMRQSQKEGLGPPPFTALIVTRKPLALFATVLTQLLGNETAVRLTVNGYMPLSIESIGTSADGNRLISLCHYGEQNGDLMRDPEMVFALFTHGEAAAAEPLSFQNDYMGVL